METKQLTAIGPVPADFYCLLLQGLLLLALQCQCQGTANEGRNLTLSIHFNANDEGTCTSIDEGTTNGEGTWTSITTLCDNT